MTGPPPELEPDLLGCADEPIRVPGAVQAHGALLAVREPDPTVVVRSANAGGLLGREVASLDEVLDVDALLADELDPRVVEVDGRRFDVVSHRADGLLVTEWEPTEDAHDVGTAWHRRLPLVLQRLQAAQDLDALAAVLASQVRALTGFDRVMVYRFDPEWNGEVVAEERRLDLEPFLGLRYPASDIPPQARALYLQNWLRLIPDARYVPSPLVPAAVDGRPLDLGGSVLRSVSPVHLEYLANMGVAASMSVSLVDEGRLWGLVACHHYTGPHRPTYTDRVAAEFLGRTASLLLHTKVGAGDAARVLDVAERQSRLVEALARTPRRPVHALVEQAETVLDLLPAGGAAVRLDGRTHLLGGTPPAARVEQLLDRLPSGATTATDAVLTVVPDGEDLVPDASGLLVVPVAGGGALAWFRPETVREVRWGGDPTTPKFVEGEHGPRLSPRQSFAAWTQEVRATSAPWRPHEVAAAEQLARHLADVASRRAGEESRLAAALQRTLLLEALPDVPGVALAARYSPSTADVVGGDWYDLVLLPNGRVSVVLGDVAGHGLGAAAVTAQLRHALRAYLLSASGPAGALLRLNELAGHLLPDELATAVVAELDPATGRVVVANAGHLPVLVLGPDGARLVDDGRGPALGMTPDASYGEVELHLSGDDRLLVFSDGLVELRGPDLSERLAQLQEVALAAPRDPDALVDAVLVALAPPDDDDVTVLVLGPR